MPEKQHLEHCLWLVARKASTEPLSRWTDQVYIQLCNELEAKTGQPISRNALKNLMHQLKTRDRIFVSGDVKNALALYAGFLSWEDFVKQNPSPSKGSFLEEETLSPEDPEARKKAEFRNKLRFVLILTLLFLLLWAGYRLQAAGISSF